MIQGDRIAERLKALNLSQTALARQLGLSQQAIGKLIHGETRNSAHILRIAQALHTSPGYLMGEIDDPDAEALEPPPVALQLVTMQVALPSEAALARMFEGLLRPLDREMPVGELAQILARRLPTGLAQLQDLTSGQGRGAARVRDEGARPRATDRP